MIQTNIDNPDLMDTSWSGASSSRKRGTKPSLRKNSKFMKSIESLVETTNRYDALSNEGWRMAPPTPKPKTQPRKTLRATPFAPQQQKREQVPSITIKEQLTNVRSEIVLLNLSNNRFLLKQVHGGTVVKIASMKEYEAFLKRCVERKIPHFTHQVDAKKRPASSCWVSPTCQLRKCVTA
jgi:hypothetical protein